MMHLDMKIVMKDAIRYSKENNDCFKLIPMMACHSKFQIGALNSQSFCERMNSAGKNIVSDNRTCLEADLINTLVVLRTNQNFIMYCQKNQARKKFRIN